MVGKATARREAARVSKRSPWLIAPGFRDWADRIVRRGGDRIPGTALRARNPRIGGSGQSLGSECADGGFGVPNANSSRESDDRRWLETEAERRGIGDRRPSAVPESKYPRDALSSPDVEQRLVRSSRRCPPLIWRHDCPPASFDDATSLGTANSQCPDARTCGMSRRLPWRRAAGQRRRGTAPPLPRHAAGARTDPGRSRSQPARRKQGGRRFAAVDLSSVRYTTSSD